MQHVNLKQKTIIKKRFRGFLPVVVDVETSGLDPQKNALLEMCIVLIDMDSNGTYLRGATYFEHVIPFIGAELNPESLEFNQIDPYQPFRFAIDEKVALDNLFGPIFSAIKNCQCQRAVLVGHNAWFDLLFIKQAVLRTGIRSPFHAFTCFDTATLSGLFYGQTVLAKATHAAGIDFDVQQAHSAIYDAEKTADLFCAILNTWNKLRI
ncbi:MAG: ribonuclease T [Legionellales bacterium RIFCSPHIGHO2_12_FULL_42_9]|nr:MAG: ribonuclease T [Legionellales bacterium RIFCSPHIGHO2_12_FULL_42_9]